MAMTTEQLKALPQSAFVAKHLQGWALCSQCNTKMVAKESAYIKESAGVAPEYLCPDCYASHPADAVPEDVWPKWHLSGDYLRRFTGPSREEGSTAYVSTGTFQKIDGNAWSSIIKGSGDILTEQQARRTLADAGHAWPSEWGAPAEPEKTPKFFIRQSPDGDGLYRRDDKSVRFAAGGGDWIDTDVSDVECNTLEVTEPAARAYAAKHNIPWPTEWDAPAEPKPEPEWQYGRDSADGMLYRWKDDDSYDWMNGRQPEPGKWRVSTTGESWAQPRCRDSDHYPHMTIITRDQAIAYAREWGSAWAEEMEPKEKAFPRWFRDGDNVWRMDTETEGKHGNYGARGKSICHTAGLVAGKEEITRSDADRITQDWPPETRVYLGLEEGKTAEPAPSTPQPIGYSCRECHVLLKPRDVPANRRPRAKCPSCGRECDDSREVLEKELWVQPGPLPGPWEKEHEWTGEYRAERPGEWYLVDGASIAIQSAGPPCSTGTRHILRKKAKPAEEVAVDVGQGGDYTCKTTCTRDDDGTINVVDIDFIETPSGKDRTMTPKRIRFSIPVPSVKSVGKYLIAWPVVTTTKLAVGFAKWAGFLGTLATAAGVTVAVRNPERAEMALRWFWGMLG